MDAARAIADPVRREILSLLWLGPQPAGAIAAHFDISRPAISRHLRVLRETRLVVDRAQGRERIYWIELAPLAELDAWLAQFRTGWSTAFDALDTEVRRTRRERERTGHRSATTTPTSPSPSAQQQEKTA